MIFLDKCLREIDRVQMGTFRMKKIGINSRENALFRTQKSAL